MCVCQITKNLVPRREEYKIELTKPSELSGQGSDYGDDNDIH